ncbi:MAG TPA: NADH-quinone oxidoreductase subunit J [Gemmata sp.]|nr:NADH-quinone oxidoreductase subunit J [Gemmata sp.]
MTLFSLTSMQNSVGQIALATILAVVGFALLLPNPKGRRVKEGMAALLASSVVLAAWVFEQFGQPMPDAIGTVLFVIFAAGALGFGTVLVVQKNPARGAIAFAFVILSTCGLFLLLAAPFLMAATIIIYAGAIIVTFLFVLMLSQTGGPSNENDRSREPWFGSLAGFAFAGLVLLTLYVSQSRANPAQAGEELNRRELLPAALVSEEERQKLTDAAGKLDEAATLLSGTDTAEARKRLGELFSPDSNGVHWEIGEVIRNLFSRLYPPTSRPGVRPSPLRTDRQALTVLESSKAIRQANDRLDADITNYLLSDKMRKDRATLKADIESLHDGVVLLSGVGRLPSRNVGNIGYLLYSEYLLAVELAGTLLLVATIGAIAISHQKGGAA